MTEALAEARPAAEMLPALPEPITELLSKREAELVEILEAKPDLAEEFEGVEGGQMDPKFLRQIRDVGSPLFSEAAILTPRKFGRRPRPDHFYAELAAEYLAAVKSGSRRPVAD